MIKTGKVISEENATMALSELDSFLLKFKCLWKTGYDAHLDFDTKAGEAWVGLRVRLGRVHGPLEQLFPKPQTRSRNGPSRQRRRERRAAARKEVEETSHSETQDNAVEASIPETQSDVAEASYIHEEVTDAEEAIVDEEIDTAIYVIEYFKNTTKDNSEAQDAINFIEDSLKEAYLKYKVDVDDQVYKIMEVNPAKEGFVIKFKMKKSPAQGWFNLAKDFRLHTRNTVYLVRQDPG